MWIIGRQQHEAWIAEGNLMEQNQAAAKLDYEQRAPKAIEVQQHPEDQPPLEFGKIVVMPGWWYGHDENGREFTCAPGDIGEDDAWIEAPMPK